jgi:hypothetical protein
MITGLGRRRYRHQGTADYQSGGYNSKSLFHGFSCNVGWSISFNTLTPQADQC